MTEAEDGFVFDLRPLFDAIEAHLSAGLAFNGRGAIASETYAAIVPDGRVLVVEMPWADA